MRKPYRASASMDEVALTDFEIVAQALAWADDVHIRNSNVAHYRARAMRLLALLQQKPEPPAGKDGAAARYGHVVAAMAEAAGTTCATRESLDQFRCQAAHFMAGLVTHGRDASMLWRVGKDEWLPS